MNSFQNWGDAVSNSMMDLWSRFIDFLPEIIGALVIFAIGLIIASALKKIVEKLAKMFHLGKPIDNSSLAKKAKESGTNVDFAKFLGELVRWFLILVFLMAATDILGLSQVTEFLDNILFYIPNIIIAVIILSVTFLIANLISGLVKSSSKMAKLGSANFLAALSKWAIIIFGLLAALIQLGIAQSLANTIFIGIVAAFSLAFGLAFGLGGKEEAAIILKKARERLMS